MPRTRLINWLIVGGVIALVVVAVVDAVRSFGGETTAVSPGGETTASAATPPTPTAGRAGSRLPSCSRRDLALSVEVRKSDGNNRVATVVMRHGGANRCYHRTFPVILKIIDREGTQIGDWGSSGGILWNEGAVSAGAEWTFALPGVLRCDRPGPFRALATVGPYSARRSNLSRSAITC